MPLSAGTRLGPYQILSALGAGGMGEVYRALDTRLNRAVAIKIVPEAFAADTERGHWTVSTNGGTRPIWTRSGQELVYASLTAHSCA